jgi:predicted membrane protein DUF2339
MASFYSNGSSIRMNPSFAVPEAEMDKELSKRNPARKAAGTTSRDVTKECTTWLREKMNMPGSEVSWEMAFGTYWLPRIGILLVTVAVVLLATLAMRHFANHPWVPHFRVGLGYATCAAFLGSGAYLMKKYRNFGHLLFGAGVGLSYFVTYATHFLGFTQIFTRPEITLSLLMIVVLLWAACAHLRKSKVLAVTVALLGNLTILISTLTPGVAERLLPLGIVALSVGSAFFLLKHGWYYVAFIGMIGGYANHLVWMLRGPAPTWPMDFYLAISVLSVYLLVFALAELLSPEKLRRDTIPTWFRSLFVTCNTASYFLLGIIVLNAFDQTCNDKHIFYFVYATVLALFGLSYLRLRKEDPLFNVYLTKAVAASTLGLAVLFSGNGLTAWLAIQTLVLLISARRSGLLVTRVLAGLVACIAFANGLHVALTAQHGVYSQPEFSGALLKASLGVLIFLVCSVLYQRTDWSVRSPAFAWLKPQDRLLLWQYDLASRPSDGTGALTKPLGGLLFPYLYAGAATVLYIASARLLVSFGHFMPVYAGFALVLSVAALCLKSKPFGFCALAAMAAAALLGGAEIALNDAITLGWAVLSLAGLAICALFSETKIVGEREGLCFHQLKGAPYVLYGVTAGLAALLVLAKAQGVQAEMLLLFIAVSCAGLTSLLHPKSMAYISVGMLCVAQGHWALEVPEELTQAWRGLAYVLIALPLLGERYYSVVMKRAGLKWLGSWLIILAAPLLVLYLTKELPRPWWSSGVSLAAFAFLAHGFATKRKGAIAVSLPLGVFAAVALVPNTFSLVPTVCGYGLLIAYWITLERLCTLSGFKWSDLEQIPGALEEADGTGLNSVPPVSIFTSLTAASMAIMIYKIPFFSENLLTVSWAVGAGALLLLSVPLKQKYYRYGGLAVFLPALLRLAFYDTRELEPVLRIIAWAATGALMVVAGFFYVRTVAKMRSASNGEE